MKYSKPCLLCSNYLVSVKYLDVTLLFHAGHLSSGHSARNVVLPLTLSLI